MSRESAPRGFAAMDPDERRKIASKGGKAAHAQGRAHQFTSEGAREAGRKGFAVIAARPGGLQENARRGVRTRAAKRAAMMAGDLPDDLRRALRDFDDGKPASHQLESVRPHLHPLEDLDLLVRCADKGWRRTDRGRALATGNGS